MNDPIDLLQIKIDKAKRELPEETRRAIDAVQWKITILEMRAKKGYTFEQLGDLELETELLLCGLLTPADYPKEIEKRMGISKVQASDLVNEMNELVFKKIREELIKSAEQKKSLEKSSIIPKIINPKIPANITAIQIKKSEPPALVAQPARNTFGGVLVKEKSKEDTHSILAQKLAGAFQIPMIKTEYSLNNISKTSPPVNDSSVPQAPKQVPKTPPAAPSKIMTDIKSASASTAKLSPSYSANKDPYRLSPDE
jgi:hypothetical protein